MVKEKAYLSAALRARFDANATFLRLPFERIDAATDAEMQSAVVKRGSATISLKCCNGMTRVSSPRPALLDAIQASASSHLQNQEAIRPRSLDLGFNIFVETLHIEKTG